jgi:UPF0271 protein
MRVVLDTSAIIYLNDFRMFDEIFTVTDVIDEVKDRVNVLKLSGIRFTIIDPKETSLKHIRTIAKETGDLEKLSKTDTKILALAKEKGITIISDDYSVQNVAEKLGVKYVSIFNKKITKRVQWGRYCDNCKKFYEDRDTCPKCGNVLIRKSITEEFIKDKNNRN